MRHLQVFGRVFTCQRHYLIVSLAAGACVMLTGCLSSSFDGVMVIQPPEPINATLYGANPCVEYKSFEFQGEGTMQVLCRVDSVRQYATRYRYQGDVQYQTHWFLVHCSVLKKEKGAWDGDTLAFPVAESTGGLSSFMSTKFVKGRFFLLGLRQTRGLPEITFCQQRSRFPPHGVIEQFDWYYVLNEEERIRRITAVRRALGIKDVRQSFSANREFRRFVVAETWLDMNYDEPEITVMDSETSECVPFHENDGGEIIIEDNGSVRNWGTLHRKGSLILEPESIGK